MSNLVETIENIKDQFEKSMSTKKWTTKKMK